jgi:predicted NUDIX family NTP pyrophosphohydrolase
MQEDCMSRRRPLRRVLSGVVIAGKGLKAAFSAGILVYRFRDGLEILLVHPGGPFWRNKDVGAWQIPKGLVGPGEDPAAAALREFEEETGIVLTNAPEPLCRVRQAGGKWVEAFVLEAEVDTNAIVSNSFEIEWPPHSGEICSFPEIDGARWFSPSRAREMMLPSQIPILDSLETMLAASRG